MIPTASRAGTIIASKPRASGDDPRTGVAAISLTA